MALSERIESDVWGPRATFVEVDLRPYGVDVAAQAARFFFRPLKLAEALRLQQRAAQVIGIPLAQLVASASEDPEEAQAAMAGAMTLLVDALANTADLDWWLELVARAEGVAVAVRRGADARVAGAIERLDADLLDELFAPCPAEALGLLWALIAEGVGPLPVLGSLRPKGLRAEGAKPTEKPESALPEKRSSRRAK